MSGLVRTRRGRPILVTGMPRSGTTWVARQLASSQNAAMTGREPMNPRNRQYALGRTLDGWARLDAPTRRQRRLLRSAYSGWNPLVYGRHGVRQWAAPLPRTHVIVKDPFAMLSLPAIVAETGALPVLVFRHPGAVLVSYRRMGWTPDSDELGAFADDDGADHTDDLSEFATMWSRLNRIALDDLERSGIEAVVVSHEAVASHGDDAVDALRMACGLSPTSRRTPARTPPSPGPIDTDRLHNLDRDPREVAAAWRSKLDDDEHRRLEDLTNDVLSRLESSSLDLERIG